jgi:hypothetical protein
MSEHIPVVVLTNDKHLWLLPGFARQFNQYWGALQKVRVFGFNTPTFTLPANFQFISLGEQLPVDRWTDGLIAMLHRIPERNFLLMLEDYWLYAEPNYSALVDCMDYMNEYGYRVLRIDVSGDRLAVDHRYYADWRRTKLVKTEPDSPYQMSFQAAIWNRDLLLDILMPGETPWQAETEGSKRFAAYAHPQYLVLGTKPAAVHYEAVWRSKTRSFNMVRIPREDRDALFELVQEARQ